MKIQRHSSLLTVRILWKYTVSGNKIGCIQLNLIKLKHKRISPNEQTLHLGFNKSHSVARNMWNEWCELGMTQGSLLLRMVLPVTVHWLSQLTPSCGRTFVPNRQGTPLDG